MRHDRRRTGARTRVTLVQLLLLTGGAVSGAAAQGDRSGWTRPADPVTIGANLYYVGSEGLAAFLLTSADGHILIDAPFEENVPGILDNIRALGFDPRDVRILLHSHAHIDHVGGFAALQEATGAELRVHAADAVFVEAGINFGVPDGAPRYRPASVARGVEHLETIRLGDLALTAHHTPGHTPGCTTWSGAVRIDGEPFTFVIVCSLTVLRSYRIVGPGASVPGQGADFCRSLAYLRTLQPDVFLAPHAAWFRLWEKNTARKDGNARAFVDSEGYRAYLAGAEAQIEGVLTAQGHNGGCATLTG